MKASKKEIALGILIGLAIGIPALVIALLLSRSGEEATMATPTAPIAVEAVALGTPTPMTPAAVSGTPSPVIAPAVEPAATAQPEAEVVTHTVAAGETLLAIALEYDVALEDLVDVSVIDDPDFISIGTVLTIPVKATVEGGSALLTVTTALTEALVPAFPLALGTPPSVTVGLLSADYPAVLEGDLNEAYPISKDVARFSVHYTAGTYPEEDLDNVTLMLQAALAHIEKTLDRRMEGSFDVYVAGSLFAFPNQSLRGRSYSASRRFFVLHDGTGNRADQQYIATHGMARVIAWNVFGRPVSAMLSEGAAVYSGMMAIADSDHMSLESFCRAYQIAGALPRVSSGLLFEGHVRDLPNYYAAGCFVQHLIESYGTAKFAELYPAGAYVDVYGETLPTLESEWRAALQSSISDPGLDPEALVKGVEEIAAAYDALFADFEDTDAAWRAYLELDAARIALLEGRLDDITPHLAAAGY